MFVARDKNGELTLFFNKPKRFDSADCWMGTLFIPLKRNDQQFKDLTWKNEPQEVVLVGNNSINMKPLKVDSEETP